MVIDDLQSAAAKLKESATDVTGIFRREYHDASDPIAHSIEFSRNARNERMRDNSVKVEQVRLEGIRLLIQFGDFLVEMRECSFQRFAMIRIGGGFEVVNDARAG